MVEDNIMEDKIINSFPEYEYIPKQPGEKKGHNMFGDEDVGFGGYVYSEPGMYGRSLTLDVNSMHPSSIIALEYFGDYTQNYKDLLTARLNIKHKEYDKVKSMFDGKLEKYLDNPSDAKSLANALKLCLNECYGYTSANFENIMKHPDNDNNIVALRGALFMARLRRKTAEMGYTLFHFKTDSCKVLHPDEKIKNYILSEGKKYGYTFEVEHSFERICLVDKANYIAKLADDDPEAPGQWTVTGDKFANPYVFKTMFSHEPIVLKDYSDVKSVKTSMYLDFNEDLAEGEHNLSFVGKVGSFIPVKDGCGGGILLRLAGFDENGNPKYAAVEGTKGWRWKETKVIETLKLKDQINLEFFKEKIDEAYNTLAQFGDVERFLSDEPYEN